MAPQGQAEAAERTESQASATRPVAALWRWRPPPAEEPDAHPEFACAAARGARLAFVAARARGKSHKHDGKHCDDWYAVSQAGPWVVICVADGAGSARLSRVGARAACEAACRTLVAHLQRLPPDRPADPGKSEAAAAVHRALEEAHRAVIRACEERQTSGWHGVLGRPLVVKDLRSTLIIAAVCPLKSGEWRYVATQIGDGRAVVFTAGGGQVHAQPVGEHTGGEYGGETDFLVDAMQRAGFAPRIEEGVVAQPLAVCVMTDGVDDLYGPGSGLSYPALMAELLLNGVLWWREPQAPVPADRLEQLRRCLDRSLQPQQRRLMEYPEEIRLQDVQRLAEALGKSLPDLLNDWGRLLYFSLAAAPIIEDPRPEQRLLAWLDGKEVRGAFDDRTLVAVLPADGWPHS